MAYHSSCVYKEQMFLFGGNNYAKTVQVSDPHAENAEKTYAPLYCLNMKTFAWTQLKTRGDIVLPRDEHSAVVDEPNSQMLVFGGFQEGERTNDTLIYNLKTNVWAKVKLPDNAPRPCPRSGHAAVVFNNSMYVFGGKADNSVKLNDLWAFNIQSQAWTRLNPVDEVRPETRSGHTACLYENFILIFGGIFEVTRELNDVYAFSLAQKRWIVLSQDSGSPVKRKTITKDGLRDLSPKLRESTPLKDSTNVEATSAQKPRGKSISTSKGIGARRVQTARSTRSRKQSPGKEANAGNNNHKNQ